jgi:hypothetical protein
MLWLLSIVCLLIWLLGLGTSKTMGGFLYVFLAVAILAAVVRLVLGRRAGKAQPRRGSFEAYRRRK